MDPIHPILPQPINIPPVVKAPSVGRIDREGQRREPDRQKPRRTKDRAAGAARASYDDGGHGLEDNDPDDGRPRVNISA